MFKKSLFNKVAVLSLVLATLGVFSGCSNTQDTVEEPTTTIEIESTISEETTTEEETTTTEESITVEETEISSETATEEETTVEIESTTEETTETVDTSSTSNGVSDSQLAQTETPKPSGDTAQTTPPSQPKQSGGKITAVDPEMGYQITMTPVGDGSGFYKDQYGEFRDAQGNLVYYNYATGEYSTDSSHAQMEVSETDLSGDLKQGSGMQFQ